MPANIGEMFYYGEMPWHRLGYKVPNPLTVEEALQAGRLDWEVGMMPLQTAEGPASPVFNRLAVVRCDREAGHAGRALGVVYNDFKPLQNRVGAMIFDAIFGKGKKVYHTGGYLKNGEVVWLLAALPKELTIVSDDVVRPYALFTNSHDGSIAVDFRLTAVRVVCENTLSLALEEGHGSVFKHAHTGDYATLQKEAEEVFESTLAAMETLEQNFKRMAQHAFDDKAMKELVFKVYPDPKPPVAPKDSPPYKAYLTMLKNVKTARDTILSLRTTGKGADMNGVKGTLWGGFNAAIEYIDHHHWLGDNYMISSLFGPKAILKRRVYKMALDYADGKAA